MPNDNNPADLNESLLRVKKPGIFAPSDLNEREQINAQIANLESKILVLKKYLEQLHSINTFMANESFVHALQFSQSSFMSVQGRIAAINKINLNELSLTPEKKIILVEQFKRILEVINAVNSQFGNVIPTLKFLEVGKKENTSYFPILENFEIRLQALKNDISGLSYSKTTHHLNRILNPLSYFKRARFTTIRHAFNSNSYTMLKESIIKLIATLNKEVPNVQVIRANLRSLIGFNEKLGEIKRAILSANIVDFPSNVKDLFDELLHIIGLLQDEIVFVESKVQELITSETQAIAQLSSLNSQ